MALSEIIDLTGGFTEQTLYDAVTTGYAQDINYDSWQDLFVNGVYQGHLGDAEITIGPPEPSDITFNAGPENDEMLKITKDGFYVRGVKVEQDAKEAENVYNAFRQWMTWNTLTGSHD